MAEVCTHHLCVLQIVFQRYASCVYRYKYNHTPKPCYQTEVLVASNGFAIGLTTGVLSFTIPRDYEALRSATGGASAVTNVTIKACDKADTPKCTTADVTVYILDVDEAPVMVPFLAGETFQIKATASSGTSVGPPAQFTDEDVYRQYGGSASCSIVNVTKSGSLVSNKFTIDPETCQVYLI